MKENKLLSSLFIVSFLLLIVFVILLVTSFFRWDTVQQEEQRLLTEVEEKGLEDEVPTNVVASKEVLSTSTIEQAGYDKKTFTADRKLAEAFFKPAFTWTKGKSYDETYEAFVEQLGEENSFVKTYLKETDTQAKAYTLDKIEFIPLHANHNTVHYVAYITYQIEDMELEDTDAFEKGLVTFTVSGEGEEREVSDVDVWE